MSNEYEMNGLPQVDQLNSDKLMEMKHHYKMSKKAWRKENRKKAGPLGIIMLILIIGIVIAIGVLIYKFIMSQEVEEDLQVIPVTTSMVSFNDMINTYNGNGDVVASNSVDVFPDTASGKVTRIDVELGQWVAKNQTLMWIDPSRPGQTYAQSPVKAPISGTITNLTPTVGSMVSAQQPLATIGDLSQLEVITHIPEKYISFISQGQEALISLIDWEDEQITGTISEVSPVVDPTSRTMRVKILLHDTDERIKAGMFVRISMVTDRYEDVLSLPTAAIIERFDDQFVYVVQGDEVERRMVLSSFSVDGLSRIDEGLELGDEVVVKGNNLLEDGSSIKVLVEE